MAEEDDHYGFLSNRERGAVTSISVELLGTPDNPGYNDYYDEEGEYDLQPKIACELVIRRADGPIIRECGYYQGNTLYNPKTGKTIASDPKGCVIISGAGVGRQGEKQVDSGSYAYSGPIVGGTMTGKKCTVVRITPAFQALEGCLGFKYTGEVENGLPHGYGELNDKEYEGYFNNGNAKKLVCRRDSNRGDFPYALLLEKSFAITTVLSEEPARDKYERFQLDVLNLDRAKPLFSTVKVINSKCCFSTSGAKVLPPEMIIEALYFCPIYGKGGTDVVGCIAVNCQALNMALSTNPADLDDLVEIGNGNGNDYLPAVALGRDSNNPDGFKMSPIRLIFNGPNSSLYVSDAQSAPFAQTKHYLLETIGRDFAVRSGRAQDNIFFGGRPEEHETLMLTLVESIGELKRVRFAAELIISPSMKVTSFLESIAIDQNVLLTTTEDYISTVVSLRNSLSPNAHAIAVILDIKKMRKIVTESSSEWRRLDSTDEVFFYIFDSSAVIGNGAFSEEYKNVLEGIERNSRRINVNIQETGSCWLYAVAAVLTAIKNPQLVARLASGEIELQKLSHVIDLSSFTDSQLSKFLNIFVVETLLTLQRIGNTYGVGLIQGRLLLGQVVNDWFAALVRKHFSDDNLLDLFELRIRLLLDCALAGYQESFGSYEQNVISESKIALQKYMSSTTGLMGGLLEKGGSLISPDETLGRDIEFVKFLEKFKRFDDRLLLAIDEIKSSPCRAHRGYGETTRDIKFPENQKSSLSPSFSSSSGRDSRIRDGSRRMFKGQSLEKYPAERDLVDEDSVDKDCILIISDEEKEFSLSENTKKKRPRSTNGINSDFVSRKNKRPRLDSVEEKVNKAEMDRLEDATDGFSESFGPSQRQK
ncbi:MAG: hypothetical protein LBU15_00215 [Rickettsiales bacterium]|jgi:hypothetical protein|nr:hypothetical protein [Rickettsiales bacterium]